MLVAIICPAILFILWDAAFTHLGVWGFNDRYLIGISIWGLPIEEILFFICIPYACVFTYEALKFLIPRDYMQSSQKTISLVLIAGSIFIGLYHVQKWYTGVTFLALAIWLIVLQYGVRAKYLSRIYFSFLFILLPFFLVNGVLTGSMIQEPVVWYHDAEYMGLRIGTIPVEDAFYGLLLFSLNIFLFEELQRRGLPST